MAPKRWTMERKNTGQLSLACTGNLRDNRQPRRLGSVLPSSNAITISAWLHCSSSCFKHRTQFFLITQRKASHPLWGHAYLTKNKSVTQTSLLKTTSWRRRTIEAASMCVPCQLIPLFLIFYIRRIFQISSLASWRTSREVRPNMETWKWQIATDITMQ